MEILYFADLLRCSYLFVVILGALSATDNDKTKFRAVLSTRTPPFSIQSTVKLPAPSLVDADETLLSSLPQDKVIALAPDLVDDQFGEPVYNTTTFTWQRKSPPDHWTKASFDNFTTDGKIITFHDNASESDIKAMLLSFYDRTSRPVYSDSQPVKVTVAFSLFNILDTNEKYHTISTLLSVRLRWKDHFLRWKSDRIKSLYIPADRIWTPDIVFANSAEATNGYVLTNTIVSSDGDVLWMFPILLKSQCIFQVFFFPFDCQKCKIVVISWTYSGRHVDLKPDPDDNNAVYYKPQNQEWFVDKINVSRNVVSYECCPNDTFPDVTFTIYMRRRSQFYVLNLIYPCLLFYILSFLGFLLPLESGDKVNMEVTVLLSLVVFMMFVNEMLPPTADMLPAIGMIVVTTMIEVVVALVMAVAVTYLSHQNVQPADIPYLLAYLLEHYGNEKISTQYREALLNHRLVDCSGIKGQVKTTVEKKVSPVFIWRLRRFVIGERPQQSQEQTIGEELPLNEPVISKSISQPIIIPHQQQLSESNSSKTGSVDSLINLASCKKIFVAPNNQYYDEGQSTSSSEKGRITKHKYNKKYWMEIARILDRIFLVVFGILSGLVNLFLYMIMLADDTPFDVFTRNYPK